MKNNVHNGNKIIDWILKRIICIISHFNHALYMKLYLCLLKHEGMDIRGNPIYIGASTQFDGKNLKKIHIGDKVVISSDVRFLTHDYSLSRAIEATGITLEKEVYLLKDIWIGENSFIGTKSIIMPGAIIGKNVIVGAGSVVRGTVPDNSMVIGNPAVYVGDTLEWAKKKLSSKDYMENKN